MKARGHQQQFKGALIQVAFFSITYRNKLLKFFRFSILRAASNHQMHERLRLGPDCRTKNKLKDQAILDIFNVRVSSYLVGFGLKLKKLLNYLRQTESVC